MNTCLSAALTFFAFFVILCACISSGTDSWMACSFQGIRCSPYSATTGELILNCGLSRCSAIYCSETKRTDDIGCSGLSSSECQQLNAARGTAGSAIAFAVISFICLYGLTYIGSREHDMKFAFLLACSNLFLLLCWISCFASVGIFSKLIGKYNVYSQADFLCLLYSYFSNTLLVNLHPDMNWVIGYSCIAMIVAGTLTCRSLIYLPK